MSGCWREEGSSTLSLAFATSSVGHVQPKWLGMGWCRTQFRSPIAWSPTPSIGTFLAIPTVCCTMHYFSTLGAVRLTVLHCSWFQKGPITIRIHLRVVKIWWKHHWLFTEVEAGRSIWLKGNLNILVRHWELLWNLLLEWLLSELLLRELMLRDRGNGSSLKCAFATFDCSH